VLEADAAARAEARGEEGAELTGAAVRGVRADGLAVIPVRREGAQDRLGIAGRQRGLVAADDIAGAGGSGLENRRPQVAPPVDRPLAAVGAEYHRLVVGELSHDRHRPGQVLPVVIQVRQQFDHGPPVSKRGGHDLGADVVLGHPGLILADEPPQLPVAPDLACAGVIDDHLAGPHRL